MPDSGSIQARKEGCGTNHGQGCAHHDSGMHDATLHGSGGYLARGKIAIGLRLGSQLGLGFEFWLGCRIQLWLARARASGLGLERELALGLGLWLGLGLGLGLGLQLGRGLAG